MTTPSRIDGVRCNIARLPAFLPHCNIAWLPAPPHSAFVGIGVAASLLVFGIFCYLVVYLPYVAHIRLDWEVYAPRAIPVATAAGLAAGVA